MVEETTTVEHYEFNESEGGDSLTAEGSYSIYQRETVEGYTGECGRINIERDSTGRPVVIFWNIYRPFSRAARTEKTETGIFTLRGSSKSTKTAGTVDSDTKKTEETKKEINPAIPLESLIGTGLILLCILYLIYIFIADVLFPWIKKLRK